MGNQDKIILINNTVGMGNEGMSHVILNYLQHMDTTSMELHFTATDDIDPYIKSVLERYGIVHYVPLKAENLLGYLKRLWKIMTLRTDVLHIHGNSGTMLIEVLLAKLCGVKNIIIHAHSTRTNHPILNSLLKVPMMYLADTCIACSKAAGDWLYGKHPYIVLNNAIDLSKFRYSEDAREKYRTEFGVKEEFLIGHIGHFTPPKNHFFLIDVFYEFHKLEPNSKLLLISDGPRFEQVKQKVSELGLQDAVIFAGRRNDIAGIYSAMDMFTLPSNWEGLPLVLVEAQANGLPILASDVITEDAICTDRFVYKSLKDGPEAWAQQLLQIRDCHYDRKTNTHPDISTKGFDIHTEAEQLRKIYFQ